jgi:Nif-specific regulatory protein
MPDSRHPAALSLVGLYEISKILSSSDNLPAALRSMLNMMASYLEMRRGVVAIVNGDEELEVIAASGQSSDADGGPGLDLPAEVARQILSGQVPFVTEDVGEYPLLANYVQSAGALDGERVSFFAVPIKTVGRPFGVLAVAKVWTEEASISFGDDIRFLTMVANLVAQTVIVHNKPNTDGGRTAPAGTRPPAPPASVSPRSRRSGPSPALAGVIGVSKAMQEVFAQVHLVAPTRSTVILRGESGTGKELIARAVHDLSPRHKGPFVKVNCAALPDTLLESELFGHDKGAFTGATQDRKGRFELADGGTLFLDEIGDISPAFQAKLLRAVQEREFERVGGSRSIKVDIRFVCATNRNLEEAVAKGEFRADLYYRINVVPVFIPSLRERTPDIPLLARHFLDAFNTENGRRLGFADEALKILSRCPFPGNVRELENCVHRIATMAATDIIDAIDVPCQTSRCHCRILLPVPAFAAEPVVDAPILPPADADWSAADDLADLDALPQRERLVRVMEKAGWVQAKAARLLGMTPRQVGYALRKHKIAIKRL